MSDRLAVGRRSAMKAGVVAASAAAVLAVPVPAEAAKTRVYSAEAQPTVDLLSARLKVAVRRIDAFRVRVTLTAVVKVRYPTELAMWVHANSQFDSGAVSRTFRVERGTRTVRMRGVVTSPRPTSRRLVRITKPLLAGLEDHTAATRIALAASLAFEARTEPIPAFKADPGR